MNGLLVVLPGSPALVRELSPADDAGGRLLAGARELLAAALGGDSARPVELVGSRAPRWRTGQAGSFAAWGAPQVTVGQGHHLPELVQRYVLGAEARRVVSARGTLGKLNPEAVTVVALDGSAGLTARAPLALIEGAAEADVWCRALLAGTPAVIPREIELTAWLSVRGVLEPELWAELAELRPAHAELKLADASLGVGRYIAGWRL